ncbi:bifunctional diaminohydroxyphosphoribosylaminopyrimidine deaminase/5-amino-6-(5-phosphoribosylamino)uracil reductase RibD, partial [Clostridium sp.]
MMILNERFMKIAIELAKKGIGNVNPNPLVGAIIVKDDKIIGQGYHEKYGQGHAEVNAFKSLTEDATGATMYVTLEPCSHYGKTPPCVDRIIENKISKVIIGMVDPNPLVAGNGIEKL